MEARRTLTAGSFFPKTLIVVLAVCGTIALAAMGAVITKDLGGSNAAVQSPIHPAAGTVLRQDNPPAESGAQISAAVGTHVGRSSGTQIVGDDSASDGNGPSSDLTRVQPTQAADYNPGWDARSVREGHGA